MESALPLLNNNRSGAGQGWPAELLRYAYREVQDEDGKTLKFHVLARPLAAILDAAFQRGILPDDVTSSLVTPVFKKGDKCDPANYRPIAVGESLSAGCMLPSSTAALSAGLRKLACKLLARRASGHVCPQSISCLLCATSLTGPDSRSSLCLQPSWTLERPMTACSTLSSRRPYSAREFMARCLRPYSHCIVEVQ